MHCALHAVVVKVIDVVDSELGISTVGEEETGETAIESTASMAINISNMTVVTAATEIVHQPLLVTTIPIPGKAMTQSLMFASTN